MVLGGAAHAMHAKTVYFVRHGQAEHNVMIELGRRDEARLLPDPPLSQVRGIAPHRWSIVDS
jgi:broad specificity phosphatase PhoE